jgi:hypothetical protein
MALTKIHGERQILGLTIKNAQIATDAAIALSKIQDGLSLVKADGSVPFTSTVAGVTPTADAHLATKGYVDSVATGLDVKQSVRAISTGNITLSGTQTVDGVALIAGDRVLVAGQTNGEENGIYVVAAGAWVRSADADNSPAGEVTSGMFTFIEEGTSYAGAGFVLTTANPVVLGTTDLAFAQFSAAGTIQAGAGLTKTGNTIDVVSGNAAIVANANDLTLTLSDSTLAIDGSGLKLASLAEANILIGSAGGVATAQALSGDATLTAAGVLTIANGAVTNDKLAGSIALNKLVSGTAGQIIVANGSGVPTYVTASGDVTVSQTGAIELVADAVGTTELANGAVTLPKLVALDAGKIIIGTSGGNAQVTMSGDATISESGVVTVDADVVVKVADVITRETPAGDLDGVNTDYTLANTPKAGTEHVFVNGILQDEGASNDYTISGAVITMTYALLATDKIRVSYFK